MSTSQNMKGKNEPNVEKALSWYPEMKNQYAPLGWKNCLFEYLLMWNGDIVVPTDIMWKKPTGMEKYKDADAQFNFYWSIGDKTEGIFSEDKHYDNSPIKRGYVDGWKPIATTERFISGLSISQEVFAHVPGGKELDNGDETMFLWVNWNIKKEIEVLVLEDEIVLYVHVTDHLLRYSMIAGANSSNKVPAGSYAHDLKLNENLLVQDDGKIRLAVIDKEDYVLNCWDTPNWPKQKNVLSIKAPLEKGEANIQMLIPVLPVQKGEIDKEISFGYENSLAETLKFWEKEYEKGIKITLPEKLVEDTFRSNPWRMMVIGEKNPVHDEYALNIGSFAYDCLWAVPSSMSNVWGLDYMGYHEDAARYLEIYRKDQGNNKPPSEHIKPHPGFLSAPKNFTAIPWLNEHGAIMWNVGEHYLLTRDKEFLCRWLPHIQKACDWIYQQRRNESHPGVKGLMPPGIATDASIQGQYIWNDGWIYKGLITIVKALRDINHPETDKWEREASEYKKRFNEVYMNTCKNSPTWKSSQGEEIPFIPTEVMGKLWESNRHCFYLDTGPLFLGFSGIVDIDSWIFDAVLKWFREGPQVKHWLLDGCISQVPILYHEMSSAEPCYSWNMDINFLRKDRYNFFEGLYAQLTGARTTDLFSDVESRNGMFSLNATTPVTFHHFRNGLVYEDGNNLELLRMVPKAWFIPGEILELRDIPTYFGSMNLSVECSKSKDKRTINLELPTKNSPEKVLLNIPPFMNVKKVLVNESEYNIWADRIIQLEGKNGEAISVTIYG